MVLLEQRHAIQALQSAAFEQKSADQFVQDSERKLRSFVESIPVLAWIANADGYITWYNRRWYEYTGTTPQQMEGWGWQSVHDPIVLPSVMKEWTESIQTGEPFEMVFPLRGADGVLRPFLTRIVPFRDEHGTLIQWFGTNAEVDALQKAQQALQQSEAELKRVLTSTTDAVMTIDRDWKLSYVNPKAEELYSIQPGSIGCDLWTALPALALPGSPFREGFAAAMDREEVRQIEAAVAHPESFTVGCEVYPSPDGIVVFSRDVTKLKTAAAAVLQNEKLAAVGPSRLFHRP